MRESRALVPALVLSAGLHGSLLLWSPEPPRRTPPPVPPPEINVRFFHPEAEAATGEDSPSIDGENRRIDNPKIEPSRPDPVLPRPKPTPAPERTVERNERPETSLPTAPTSDSLLPAPDTEAPSPPRPAEEAPDDREALASGDGERGSQAINRAGTESTQRGRRRGSRASSTLPRPAFTPKPPYPVRSRDLGEEGTVVIAILVGADGRIEACQVAASSGYPSLDGTALSTVRQRWRFEPGLENGQPTPQWVRVPVEFRIRRR